MWSEHCSYKSSRIHLKKLPTHGKYVVQGPGENAGIIGIGGGWVIAFKIESHNHPSYIEPFQGAATGVGGILRDIFTMGARPIAVMDSLRFGPITDAPKPSTIGAFWPAWSAASRTTETASACRRWAANAFSKSAIRRIRWSMFSRWGLQRERDFLRAALPGIGNPVIYVGAKTGRDGIHGASMASAEFTEESKQKRPNVQVGDPFLEKLLLEACIEAMKTGAIVAIQDMGAAGLTSSSCEMGSRGGVGHRYRSGPGSAARNRHDGIRNAAFGIPGAHAAGRGKRPRRGSFPRLPQMGTRCGDHRRGDARMAICASGIMAKSSPKFLTRRWPMKRRNMTVRIT